MTDETSRSMPLPAVSEATVKVTPPVWRICIFAPLSRV
jgi:hypothetical protein